MSSSEVKSSDPCPLCLNNGVVNPLIDRPGQFFTTCRAGHKFEDTTELNLLRTEARRKFPNFYKPPDAPKPTDPAVFANAPIVIDPESKKAIEEMAGVTFTSAGDLKGTLFHYVQDNKDKETEIKRLSAAMKTIRGRVNKPGQPPESVNADQVVITLPEWALEGGIAEQAEYAGMSVQDWVQQEVGAYFENYFARGARQA
jgi:hypothetical protein